MQADEITRLTNESLQHQEQSKTGISQDTVIKLTQKVDDLRFSYLEKERELSTLQSEL